ncbi:hypothetical protein NUSPORA_00593 [Nucleospora cyclopteri]
MPEKRKSTKKQLKLTEITNNAIGIKKVDNEEIEKCVLTEEDEILHLNLRNEGVEFIYNGSDQESDFYCGKDLNSDDIQL